MSEAELTTKDYMNGRQRLLLLFQSKAALQESAWLTVREFAIAWGKSESAVASMMHRGLLESVHPPGSRSIVINNTDYRHKNGLLTSVDYEAIAKQNELLLDADSWEGKLYKGNNNE